MKLRISLIAALLALPLCSCGGGNDGPAIDKTKTQLYIMYIDQGFAGDWIQQLISRFEARYADYSFEEGKTGVQVIANGTGDIKLLPSVQSRGDESIFFVENYNADFTAGQDATKTAAADLTELFSKGLNQSFGQDLNGKEIPGASDEEASVISKLRDCEKDYYLIDKDYGEKRIFGVPYIDCYRGTLSYDEDLFNEKDYFFGYDGSGKYGIGYNKKTSGVTLGEGPDGVSGTADDGLPRTYEEFYLLCDSMCDDTVAPITFAGNWSGYLQDLMFSLRAQSAGAQQTRELYTGSGTLKDYLPSTSGNLSTFVGEEMTYDTSTFSRTYRTLSEYAPVDFMYRLVKNPAPHQYFMGANNFTSSYTHLNAQADLILAEQNASQLRVGMTIDGTWWWNEAKDAINKYKTKTGEDAANRNIKYMPLPKANTAAYNRTIGENVAFSDYNTAIVEKNNLTGARKLLSDMFISFCCTNESLVEWNLSVQCPRGLSYTLSEEDISKLSVYGKSVYYIHSSHESTDANNNYSTFTSVYNQSNSEFYKSQNQHFQVEKVFDAGSYLSNYVTARGFFQDSGNTKTIEGYFSSLLSTHGAYLMVATITSKNNKKYRKTNWKKLAFYIGLISLPIIQYLIFSIVVNFNSIILAFQKYEYISSLDTYVVRWAGFENFKQIFNEFFIEHKFNKMLSNSTIAYLSGLVITTPLALVFSYYISKKLRGAKIFRTILFMPTIISTVVLACVFRLLGETIIPFAMYKIFYSADMTWLQFSRNIELMSSFQLIGGDHTNTFTGLIFYHVFMGFGTNVLLYSGAMSAIDPSTIEAAKIDGCSDWKEFIHVILPGIFPTIVSFIVVGIGVFFTQRLAIYDMYGTQAMGSDFQTIGYYLYTETLTADNGIGKYGDYPYLSALGVIFTLIVTPISFLVKYLLEKFGPSTK